MNETLSQSQRYELAMGLVVATATHTTAPRKPGALIERLLQQRGMREKIQQLKSHDFDHWMAAGLAK